jgi:hypothetical protein
MARRCRTLQGSGTAALRHLAARTAENGKLYRRATPGPCEPVVCKSHAAASGTQRSVADQLFCDNCSRMAGFW